MKAQFPRPRRQRTPLRVSLRPALLAFALLVLQPSHWATCCLAALSGAHVTPSASHSHTEQNTADGELAWNLAHQHADATSHPTPQFDAHSDTFVITPHHIRLTHHHHHPPCCAGCGAASLVEKPARFAGHEAKLLCSYTSIASPVFRLDAPEDYFTRAGPSDAVPFSVHRASSLLGRAPPLSV